MMKKTKNAADDINRMATWAELRELTRPFFREFGLATWSAMIGVLIGLLLAWWIWQVYLSTLTSAVCLVSVGMVYTLGVASVGVAWLVWKTIAFIARVRKED